MDTEATKPLPASLFPPNINPLVPYDRRAQVSATAGAAKTATGLLRPLAGAARAAKVHSSVALTHLSEASGAAIGSFFVAGSGERAAWVKGVLRGLHQGVSDEDAPPLLLLLVSELKSESTAFLALDGHSGG